MKTLSRSKYGDIAIYAGQRALGVIRDGGLSPQSIRMVAGAAGGPKWLVLYGFDRMLVSWLLAGRSEPLSFIGSSIGAWRFAALAQNNPAAALDAFLEAYLSQRYSARPDEGEVTRESYRVMDAYVSERSVREILEHPAARLSLLAVRSAGPAASDSRFPLVSALAISASLNVITRRAMRLFFARTLFHDPRERVLFSGKDAFPVTRVALTAHNFKPALMAAGSIPLVMRAVSKISGAPEGAYRDGGLIDYHMDIPFGVDGGGMVLFPHFHSRIVPGWFDKPLTWRKPRPEHLANMLLVAPSARFTERLPHGKIPDRNDFYLFAGRDRERLAYWRRVVSESERLAGLFHEAVESGAVRDLVRPFA